MSFDWWEYLHLADYMHDNRLGFPDEEACCRAASSRAYYASYGSARAATLAKHGNAYISFGSAPSRALSKHQALQEFLKSRGGTEEHVGVKLKRLHQFRIQADYHEQVQDPPRHTLMSIIMAREIRALLDRL